MILRLPHGHTHHQPGHARGESTYKSGRIRRCKAVPYHGWPPEAFRHGLQEVHKSGLLRQAPQIVQHQERDGGEEALWVRLQGVVQVRGHADPDVSQGLGLLAWLRLRHRQAAGREQRSNFQHHARVGREHEDGRPATAPSGSSPLLRPEVPHHRPEIHQGPLGFHHRGLNQDVPAAVRQRPSSEGRLLELCSATKFLGDELQDRSPHCIRPILRWQGRRSLLRPLPDTPGNLESLLLRVSLPIRKLGGSRNRFRDL
mmetsp:Transcript_53133/g.172772  ORF Transcript_53133/g.172772 Transcript_53133/m.172772 type:complete len:257 (+) Transcript_53133:706-1476(+)